MEYTLAFDRPMDMSPAIWPWALRPIHHQNSSSSPIGSSHTSSEPTMLELGGRNSTLTPFSFIRARSASGMAAGAVVLKSPLPSLYLPAIRDVSLVTFTEATSPAVTFSMKVL